MKRKDFEIGETKERLFERYDWKCGICGEPLNQTGAHKQLAHRVPNGPTNRRKYGENIIHHDLNLVPVCCLACNDAVLIGCDPEAERNLIEKIRKAINETV